MLRKLLIVGVGGSGGKTLWVLRDELDRALKARRWPSGRDFPECWQFLHIDTPKVVNEGSADFPPPLPNSMYLGLARPGVEYRELDEILCREEAARQVLAGWRPDDPLSVTTPLQLGAGQWRAVGAMTLQYAAREVAQALGDRVSVLSNTIASADLDEVNRLFNATSSGGNADPLVMVVGSIAGGSGSGLFLDVCDILRLALRSETKSKIYGVIYGPDTFSELEGEATGVHGNALAAITELLAASINLGEPTTDEVNLLKRAALPNADRLIRRGPDIPFLVGRANANIEFAEADEVFRSIGRALAVWVSDEDVQNDLLSYTTGNAEQNAAKTPTDETRVSPTVKGVLSSFGHASVGLARSQFRRYAADRLAAAAVKKLLEKHHADPAAGPAGDRERFEARVEEAFRTFKDQAQLWEAGDYSDIERALFDRDHQEGWIERTTKEIMDQVEPQIPALAGQGRIGQLLGDQVRHREAEFKRDQRDRLDAASAAWVEGVQDRVLVALTQVIARYGLTVATGVVNRMVTELEDVVETEFKLKRGHKDLPTFEETFSRSARQSWSADSAGKAPTKSPKGRGAARSSSTAPAVGGAKLVETIKSLAKDSLKAVWGGPAQHEMYDRAVTLVSDFIENLLRPLARELDRQESDLRLSCLGTPERPSAFEVWDRASRAVPRLLKPAQNQLLLENVERFPGVYEEQLQATTGESDPSTAEKSAIERLFLKSSEEVAEPPLIRYQQRWVPKEAAQYLGKSSQPALFAFATDLEDLHSRTLGWLDSPGQRIGEYCREDLATYLRGEGLKKAERDERLQLFRDRFRQVFSLAAPLARLSPTGMSLIHHLKADSAEIVSAIPRLPFDEGHPARALAEQVLKEQGYGSSASRMFGDGSMTQAIEVATVFGRPYNPFVFASLVSPIEATIKQLRISGSYGDLWKRRRARQLPRAIALDPSYRRAMIRGWWIARMMGHVRGIDEETFNETAVTIWSGEGWSAFPYPLLTGPRVAPEVLPTLLEAFPLSILDAVTLNSYVPLEPYRRLLRLGGVPEEGGYVEDDPGLPREFRDWLKSGVVPTGASDRFATAVDQTDRVTQVIAHLAGVRRFFEEERFPAAERDLTMRVVPDWELRHDILDVLHKLEQRCSDVNSTAGPLPG